MKNSKKIIFWIGTHVRLWCPSCKRPGDKKDEKLSWVERVKKNRVFGIKIKFKF